MSVLYEKALLKTPTLSLLLLLAPPRRRPAVPGREDLDGPALRAAPAAHLERLVECERDVHGRDLRARVGLARLDARAQVPLGRDDAVALGVRRRRRVEVARLVAGARDEGPVVGRVPVGEASCERGSKR